MYQELFQGINCVCQNQACKSKGFALKFTAKNMFSFVSTEHHYEQLIPGIKECYPSANNFIPLRNQLIEDVHNGSNYTTITTAGTGYKDVVGFHSDKQRF